MVQNKKGRKSNTLYGYEDRYVDTWAMFDGVWVYQGKSKKKVIGTENDGEYSYYTTCGVQMKQAL